MRSILCSLLVVSGCSDKSGGVDAKSGGVDASPDAPQYLCDDGNLMDSLRAVPGVVSAMEMDCGEYLQLPARCVKLGFTQPVQHGVADGNSFIQTIDLMHRGCNEPMVIADWGYEIFPVFYETELSYRWHTNAMNVEHRFQGTSLPTTWDWTALTVANGAADQHAIISTFRTFYRAAWVSTGASKGGISAVYHHYLYPTDLDGTVPYVAPASRSAHDPEYQTYIEATMEPSCQQAMETALLDALTTRRSAGIEYPGPAVALNSVKTLTSTIAA